MNIGSLFGAMAAGPAPQIARDEIPAGDGTLLVSTVDSYDCGPETAICDANGAHPVERYKTRDEAVIGHAKWIKDAPTLKTIIRLGYGKVAEDEEVTLVPVRK